MLLWTSVTALGGGDRHRPKHFGLVGRGVDTDRPLWPRSRRDRPRPLGVGRLSVEIFRRHASKI